MDNWASRNTPEWMPNKMTVIIILLLCCFLMALRMFALLTDVENGNRTIAEAELLMDSFRRSFKEIDPVCRGKIGKQATKAMGEILKLRKQR